jgi:uncharacterized protein (DUF779 family)
VKLTQKMKHTLLIGGGVAAALALVAVAVAAQSKSAASGSGGSSGGGGGGCQPTTQLVNGHKYQIIGQAAGAPTTIQDGQTFMSLLAQQFGGTATVTSVSPPGTITFTWSGPTVPMAPTASQSVLDCGAA